jgi:hypothetical protein
MENRIKAVIETKIKEYKQCAGETGILGGSCKPSYWEVGI